MIDTHCHLTDPRLASQLDDVLSRAAAAGVGRLITIGTNLEDDAAAIALCQSHLNVRCAIGVHPNYCADVPMESLARLRDLQADRSVVALGEMGLDYFHKHAPRDKQRKAFEYQLNLAAELNRPVVIHSRESIDDSLAVMKKFPSVRAVFHCFTGSPAEAEKILAAGYFISFTGAVTFKKNDSLREACGLVPLDRLMVETDAPYLSPEPVRAQKTNEPAFVMHVASVVAAVKQLSLNQLDDLTTQNAANFFGWA